MKKIAISLSLISSIVLAGDYYGGVDIGFGKGSETWKGTSSSIDYDFSNINYGVHIGKTLNINSMVELYFKSLTFDFKQNGAVDEDGTQFGADYLYRFDNISEAKIKPYIALGVTYNNKDAHILGIDENSIDGLGFKLRGGVYYALTPKLDLGVDLNYNYISWADVESTIDNSTQLEMSSGFYGLGLNLNYKF